MLLGTPAVLLLHEIARYIRFSVADYAHAAALDLAWFVLFCGSVVALSPTSAIELLFLYAVSALVPAVVDLGRRVRPAGVSATIEWVSNRRADIWVFGAESMLEVASSYVLLVVWSVVYGDGVAAELNASRTLLGGVGVFVMASTSVLLPRLRSEELMKQMAVVSRWSVLLGGAAVLTGLLAWVVPDRLGTELLGETWISGQRLLGLWAAIVFSQAVSHPFRLLLRARQEARLLLSARVVGVVCAVGVSMLGTSVAGPAQGVSLGLLSANVASGTVAVAGLTIPRKRFQFLRKVGRVVQ